MSAIRMLKDMELMGLDDSKRDELLRSPQYLKFKKEYNEHFKESFSLLDKNKDDTICVEELERALQIVGQNPTPAQMNKYMTVIDLNKTGKIEYDEFLYLMYQIYSTPDELKKCLMDAFRVFDKDDNKLIDAREFRQVVGQYGDTLSEDELEKMMAVADRNNDGMIDYEEFCALMVEDFN